MVTRDFPTWARLHAAHICTARGRGCQAASPRPRQTPCKQAQLLNEPLLVLAGPQWVHDGNFPWAMSSAGEQRSFPVATPLPLPPPCAASPSVQSNSSWLHVRTCLLSQYSRRLHSRRLPDARTRSRRSRSRRYRQFSASSDLEHPPVGVCYPTISDVILPPARRLTLAW